MTYRRGNHNPAITDVFETSKVPSEAWITILTMQRASHRQKWHFSFSAYNLSRSYRLLLLFGLGIVAASCGFSMSTSSTSSSTTAPRPILSVSPHTAIVGGQQLEVKLTGFPHDATIAVYECAGISAAVNSVVHSHQCSGSIDLYTGSSGSASGSLIAQPSVGHAQIGALTTCESQCVLVGVVIKVGASVTSSPALMATTPLSFSTTATPSLKNAFLEDLSWVSATEGWALAAQPCTTGLCARLAHTTDGGSHWEALPSPPGYIQGGNQDCTKVTCVSHVRFANSTVGYLFGPGLLMTTDGGQSWHAQQGPLTETLKVANARVYRVTFNNYGCPGPCQPILQESAPGSVVWKNVLSNIAYPARSDTAQIVSSGSVMLIAMFGSPAGPVSAQAYVYRSSDGGVSWQQISDPCSGIGPGGRAQEEDLMYLASSPAGFFAGLCGPHSASATFVVDSTDGGQSWHVAGVTLRKVQNLALLAVASPSVFAVSTGSTVGGGPYTTQLLVTTDGGRHWTTAATNTQQLTQMGVPAWLGFETSKVGRWISGPHSIWSTNDAGSHWSQTAFH